MKKLIAFTVGLLLACIAPAKAELQWGAGGTAPVAGGPLCTITANPGNVQNCAASGAGQTSVASPTAPASTAAYKMQGLAGSITPKRSGIILITISGTATSSTVTAGDGIQYQISYGTGSAPSNGGALAGTQNSTIQKYVNPATVIAADVATPFSTTVVVTGLTIGTAYWIDLAAESIATVSSGGLSAVSVTAVEL